MVWLESLLTWLRYRNLKDIFQGWRGAGRRLASSDYFLASGASGTLPGFSRTGLTKKQTNCRQVS